MGLCQPGREGGVARSILLTATTVSSMIDTPQIDYRTLSEFERQGYAVESLSRACLASCEGSREGDRDNYARRFFFEPFDL